MLNFTQRLYYKIIALTIAVSLFFEASVYGMEVRVEGTLRREVPSTREEHLRAPLSGGEVVEELTLKLAKFYGTTLKAEQICELARLLVSDEREDEDSRKRGIEVLKTMIDAHFDAREEVSEEDKTQFNNLLVDALSQTEKREDEDGEYLWIRTSLVPALFGDSKDPETLAALAAEAMFSMLLKGMRDMGWDKDEDKESQINLAMIEAHTNAVRHGHEGDVYKVIEEESHIYKDKMTDSVEHQGKGIILGNIPDPTKPENLFRLNGRGLCIMCESADNAVIEGNKVTMTFFNWKYLKTQRRWGIDDLPFINSLFAKRETEPYWWRYLYSLNARLGGVQLLSMIGVHHSEVREKLEEIVQDKDENELVKQKAQSVLTSYVRVVIGKEREIEIDEYTDIRERAVEVLKELKEEGCYATEVIFKTHSEGDMKETEFAVYSLTEGGYINLREKGSEVKKCWGNVKWKVDDKGERVYPFAHMHIVLENGKGGHLQTISTKGKLIIRPLWGVCIGGDDVVVNEGRGFDPWKLREERVPEGVKGKRGVVVRIDDDEDPVEKIKKICEQEGIKKARFRVIGACDRTKDPDEEYQGSVTLEGEEEPRKLYHEYLIEGEIGVGRDGETVITIYLADEKGNITEGKLVKLNNVALGEVVLEIEVSINHPTEDEVEDQAFIDEVYKLNLHPAAKRLRLTREQIKRQLRENRRGTLIARDAEGNIIGISFSLTIELDSIDNMPRSREELLSRGTLEGGNTRVLFYLFVDPESQHRGVGTALARGQLEMAAKDERIENIYTLTPVSEKDIYDDPAVKFHMSNGAYPGWIIETEEGLRYVVMVYKSEYGPEEEWIEWNLGWMKLARRRWQLKKARMILKCWKPFTEEKYYKLNSYILDKHELNLKELFTDTIIAKLQNPSLSVDEINALFEAFLERNIPIERDAGRPLDELMRQNIEQFLQDNVPVSGKLPDKSARENISAI